MTGPGRAMVWLAAVLQAAWLGGILLSSAASSPSRVGLALLVTPVTAVLCAWLPARAGEGADAVARWLIRRELVLVGLILLGVLAVGLVYTRHENLSFSDERWLAVVARAIADRGVGAFLRDYTSFVWLGDRHPPLLPLLYGAVAAAWDTSLPTLRLLGVGFMAGEVLVAYLVARRLYDVPTAALTCVVLLAFPYTTRLGSVAMIDVPLAFWSTLVFLLLLRLEASPRRADAVALGVAFAAGVLTKYAMLLAVPGLAAWIALRPGLRRGGRHLAGACAVSVAILAVWGVVAWSLGILQAQVPAVAGAAGYVAGRPTGNRWMLEAWLVRLPSALGVHTLPLLGAGLSLLFRRRALADRSVLAAVAAIALPVTLMTPDPRYYLPAFPFLAIAGACWLRSTTPVSRLRVVTFTVLSTVSALAIYWDWQRQTRLFPRRG